MDQQLVSLFCLNFRVNSSNFPAQVPEVWRWTRLLHLSSTTFRKEINPRKETNNQLDVLPLFPKTMRIKTLPFKKLRLCHLFGWHIWVSGKNIFVYILSQNIFVYILSHFVISICHKFFIPITVPYNYTVMTYFNCLRFLGLCSSIRLIRMQSSQWIRQER